MERMKKIALTWIGVFIILIGSLSNQFVMAQNDGKMPVKDFNGIESLNPFNLHTNLDENTKYPFLADIIFSFSIGDILMLIGIIPLAIGSFTKEEII